MDRWQSASKRKVVIVTSDGLPDVCPPGNVANGQQRQRLIQQTLDANPGLTVTVHTVWIGQRNDRDGQRFLRQLAEAHGGTFQAVGI